MEATAGMGFALLVLSKAATLFPRASDLATPLIRLMSTPVASDERLLFNTGCKMMLRAGSALVATAFNSIGRDRIVFVWLFAKLVVSFVFLALSKSGNFPRVVAMTAAVIRLVMNDIQRGA